MPLNMSANQIIARAIVSILRDLRTKGVPVHLAQRPPKDRVKGVRKSRGNAPQPQRRSNCRSFPPSSSNKARTRISATCWPSRLCADLAHGRPTTQFVPE